MTTANDFEGVFNLLKMWANESDPAERDAIVSDIQELIDDCSQPEKVEDVYVGFDDLDRIASDVRNTKTACERWLTNGAGSANWPSLRLFLNLHCLDFSIPRRDASSYYAAQDRPSTEFESNSDCH